MCIVYHSFPENAIEKPQILPGFFAGGYEKEEASLQKLRRTGCVQTESRGTTPCEPSPAGLVCFISPQAYTRSPNPRTALSRRR